MRFNSGPVQRFFRFLFFGLFSWFVIAFWCTFLQGIRMGILEWQFCFAPTVFTLGLLCAKYQSASGELTEEGVYVRHFLLRRFYPWSDILQAGILKRKNVRGELCELIMVKPGGSPRKAGDATLLFTLRNFFRLIHIPDDPELVDYVTAHHGPLAYDQRTGIWE